MAATSQPISITPQTRSQSQGQTQGWATKPTCNGEGSQSWPGTSLSLNSKLYPGLSPAGQLLNSLESVSHLVSCLSFRTLMSVCVLFFLFVCSPNDFNCRVSSSIESDHSSLINSHMPEREIEQVSFRRVCISRVSTARSFSSSPHPRLSVCLNLRSVIVCVRLFQVLSAHW